MSSNTTYMMTDTQNIGSKERIGEQETGETEEGQYSVHSPVILSLA